MNNILVICSLISLIVLAGCQFGRRTSRIIAPTELQSTSTAPLPSESILEPTISAPTKSLPSQTAIMPTETLSSSIDADLKLGIHAANAVGEKRYVIIMADFPDVERRLSEKLMADRLITRLSAYLDEASYHKLIFKGEMTKRYTMPNPVGYYKISPANLEVDRTRVVSLVNDAVNAADADVYFTEDLYVIILLGATPQEYGMIGYCALPGMLGYMDNKPILTNSGEVVANVVVFCENAHPGTHVHDTLHMLGGYADGRRMTPCLYDQDLQALHADSRDLGVIAVSMGYWDPLSSHVPYNRELAPTGLSSWTKLRLGWIDPQKIALVNPGETATIRLDPLISDDADTLVIKIPITDATYYLVENRQLIGSDASLPSSGVLVLFADDTVLESRHGDAPVKIMDANPSVPYFKDGAFDVGKNDIFVDAGNNLAIVLLEKIGQSYDVLITTPDQVQSE